jgi:hypothetical protein
MQIVVHTAGSTQTVRAASSRVVAPSRLAKPPVNLRVVWDTFLKRVGHKPVKEMFTTSEPKFSKEPQLEKVEGRFLNLRQRPILKAMEGLTEVSPITKIKGGVYTHKGTWEYSGKDIKFQATVYRYKGDDVLVVFTRWEVLPREQAANERRIAAEKKKREAIRAAEAKLEAELNEMDELDDLEGDD